MGAEGENGFGRRMGADEWGQTNGETEFRFSFVCPHSSANSGLQDGRSFRRLAREHGRIWQGNLGQRNGGKGMGTGNFLSSFLCLHSFAKPVSGIGFKLRLATARSSGRGHGTAGVSPASSGGVSPPVPTRSETPRELAGETPAVPCVGRRFGRGSRRVRLLTSAATEGGVHSKGRLVTVWVSVRPWRSGAYISSILVEGAVAVPAVRTRAR